MFVKDGAIDLISGSLGGVAVVYIGQSLDTVKVKMQTFPTAYSGMLDCFVKTYKSEGLARGLYAGTIPAIAANVAENSVLFACYGFCQKLVATAARKPLDDLNTLENATAGSLASFFSAFTLCPTELIKVKLQCAKEVASVSGDKLHLTSLQLIRQIVAQKGLTGLFTGLQSTIAREMPGYFVFFGAYEGCRVALAPKGKGKDDCSVGATIVAGGAAGVALWCVIYPIDAVKSRIQASTHAVDTGFFKYTATIVRKEGISALYSGLQPTLIRTIPATAALFLTYEWSKKFLHELFHKEEIFYAETTILDRSL